MPQYLARSKGAPVNAGQPVNQPMRIAQPGERPPSRYGPGQGPSVIDRFDAYMAATQGIVRTNTEGTRVT